MTEQINKLFRKEAGGVAVAGTSRDTSLGETTAATRIKKGKTKEGKREHRKPKAKRKKEVSDSSESEGRSRSRLRSSSRRAKGLIEDSDPPTDEDCSADSLLEDEVLSSYEEDSDVECVEEVRSTPQYKLTEEQLDQARVIMKGATEGVVELVGEKDCPSLSKVRKKEDKGRHATSGELYLKQLLNAQKELIARARELRMLQDAVTPRDLSNSRKLEEKQAEEEYKNTPTEDLSNEILEGVAGIDMVSTKSKSLKGPLQGRLNRSAARIKAAVSELVKRYNAPQAGYQKDIETEKLREHIAAQDREIVSLKEMKEKMMGQLEETQRELRELRSQMVNTQLQREDRDNEYVRTNPNGRGAKRRRPAPLIQDSSSEPEDHCQEGEPAEVKTGQAREKEMGEKGENSRDRVMEEIAKEGMPAAIRPPIQGQVKIIDPALPARSTEMDISTESMEERLARMLVTCVNEKVEAMEEHMMSRLTNLIVLTQEKNGRGDKTPVNPPNKTPATPVVKNREGKDGNKGKRKEAPPPVPTSTATRSRSQVQGKPRTPVPTLAVTKSQPQVLGRSKTSVPMEVETEVVPTAPTTNEDGSWSQVVRRGGKKKAQPEVATKKANKLADAKNATNKTEQGGKGKKNSPPATQQAKVRKRRVPRTAAVILTCPEGEYAECMTEVRQKIQLENIGITKVPKVRRTATGALSLEIAGQDNGMKADTLAAKMTEALSGREGVRVSRPFMTADIRLSGFEESVKESEIKESLSQKSGAIPLSFAVGPIRKMANGLCSVVAKCPLATANTLAKEGRVALGWSSSQVTMLEKRPLQCYKCLELGHTRLTCKSTEDRTGTCYRCGEPGHAARNCQAPVKCAVCFSKGLPHNHRVGGPACQKNRKGGGKGNDRKKEEERKKIGEKSTPDMMKGKDKSRGKIKNTSNLKVTGFQVTEDGRLIAGVVSQEKKKETQLPPSSSIEKEKKKDAKKSGLELMDAEGEPLPQRERKVRKEKQEGIPAQATEEKAIERMETSEEAGETVQQENEKDGEEDLVGYM